MINAEFVVIIHDEILNHERGLQGYTNHGALESCLGRIDNQMLYDPLDDIFDIASFMQSQSLKPMRLLMVINAPL